MPLAAGWVAMLSVMAWAAAGSAAIVVSLIVPLRRRWLLVLAALLFALAADDAFMFHERVGPSVGIPQSVFYGVYAVTAAWLVYYSVRHFSDGSTVALIVAGGALAISIGIDLLVEEEYIFEDGLKLLGALVMATVAPLALLSVHPTLIKRVPSAEGGVSRESAPVDQVHAGSDSNTAQRS